MFKAESMAFLERLMLTASPSGYEAEAARTFRDYLADCCDVRCDVMGNTIAALNADAPLRVLIDAHYDEIGFQIVYISDEGLLYFRNNGGIDKLNVPASEVDILTAKGRVPGVIGKKLDTVKLAEDLRETLTTLNLPKGVIELVPEDIAPFITTEDIAQIDTVLGTYSTYYYPGDHGDNIWIAANSISNKIVKPSWTFSFNDTVGPRTWDNGYKVAGVIINGKPDVDYGGGVCQVSSTLYNAVLLAGLTPTERTPHFFASSYIGLARDATVADGQIDFKFRNDLLHNVYLIAEASGSTLTVSVLGTKADLNGADISLETEGTSLYRVWRNGGEVIRDEYLHTDVYETPKPART